ncbi:MAG: nucleotide exchange factor GrpE [Promethearchaeota archaeon]
MPRREKGETRSMLFEDIFDRFSVERGGSRGQRSPESVSLSKEEYEALKAKVEQYEALVDEHKKVKTWNDQLMKELDDMKQDARNFKELQEEKEKFLKQLLQIRADFANHKKREAREGARYKQYVLEGFLLKLLSHYDDLIRALNLMKMLEGMEGIRKGFEIVVRNFEKVIKEEGVEPMESEGQKFDPYKHEAMLVEKGRDDLPENTIVEVLDKGYYIRDKVLRPAKVKISKPSCKPGQTSQSNKSSLQNFTKKIEVN